MRRIVLFQNGLGNQMFEYAFYLMMKKHFPDTVASTYILSRRKDHNGLELDNLFGVSWDEAPELDWLVRFCRKCYYLSLSEGIIAFGARQILKLLYFLHLGLCLERPEIRCQDSSYVWKRNYRIYWGGWMSEQWFASISDEIRRYFLFDENRCSIQTRNLLYELANSDKETVSIHIRRGDYLKNYQYLDICDEAYYQKAINMISEKFPEVHFYIFSDDINWCRENLEFSMENVTYVNWNHETDSWQDMFLMSRCRHNIIANSSFSWWAAWLNSNSKKIVICPRKYSKTVNLVNVMPERWIKI